MIQFRAPRLIEGIEQPDGGRDFYACALTLHTAWRQNDFQRRIAPLDHMQHVSNRRARQGSHQTDTLWKFREWPFSFLGEQTFGIELLFQLFESDLERPYALQLD